MHPFGAIGYRRLPGRQRQPDTVLNTYRTGGGRLDPEVRYRADRHWELRELTGVPFAQAISDEAEISECISKLRAGPIFG
jgi:hypothetical protein